MLNLFLVKLTCQLFFFQPTQANVVCVVYDVTNEDTIDKVVTCQLVYIVSYCTSISHTYITFTHCI